MNKSVKRVVGVVGLAACFAATAQTWVPLSGSGKSRTADITSVTVFPVPKSISARGGTMRAVLVAGGEGGWAAKANCEDASIQGGRGGDGGEVVEVEITLAPGQCSKGLVAVPGAGGRGAMRAGWNATEGERGGDTTLSCDGAVLAQAKGGGRRQDEVSAPMASRGGAGASIVNTQDSSKNESLDLRNWVPQPARDGHAARYGFGSGGGGGGVSLQTNGVIVRADGSDFKGTTIRNVPPGKGGFGGGAGGGPVGFTADASMVLAENANKYGAGGGGAAAICRGGGAVASDAGNASQGLIRLSWVD